MGRLQQPDSQSSYLPEMEPQSEYSDPQTEQYQYQPETDTTGDHPQEISPTAYESSHQFNPENPQQNDPTNQQQPSQYPPQHMPTNPNPNPNPTYPINPTPRNNSPQVQPTNYAPQTYPPQVQPTNYQTQASPVHTYPPTRHQPQPVQVQPTMQQQQQQQQQTYPPTHPAVQVQPINFPPPPPPSQAAYDPYKPTAADQLNGAAAQGFPVQQQQYPPVSPVPAVYGRNVGTVGWTTGLFDCMDDPTNALTTAFFPCLTFGQIAEIVDNGHTTCGTSGLIYGGIALLIWLPCLMSCTYRTKLRSKYGLIEAPAPDWVTHFLFEWCALCQEYRELQNRGLDPSIGWQGNAIKNQNMQQQQQQQQVAMMPPINQTMMG